MLSSRVYGPLIPNIGFFNYSINRQAKMLDKLIEKGKFKKEKYLEKNKNISREAFPFKSQVRTKRMAVLNKTFMSHVAEIMNSGKNSSKLLDFGIEVTKVQIDSKFQNVKVYWMSSKEDLDVNTVANVLNSTAGELGHEISSLRFMGRWPEIVFVRDICVENSIKVEKILSELDLDENSDSSANVSEDNVLPKMRHDILGLDHSKILNRLMAVVGRKKPVEIQQVSDPQAKTEEFSSLKGKLISFDKNAFAKFYQKQRILQKKLNKAQ